MTFERSMSIFRQSLCCDRRALLSLIALAVVLKVIILLQNPILARDGIHHIRLAHELSERPWNTVLREQPFHPGYGFTLLVASHIFEAISPGPLTPCEWQWCAHLSSSLAGVLLILPLYGLARCFYSIRIAWLGCFLFLMLPTIAQVTTDALTESWYLLFVLSSLWALVHGVRTQRSNWFVLAGLLAGAGYLVRVEAIILPAAFLVFLMLWRHRPGAWLPSGTSLRNLAILSICFLLPPLPYMMAIGKLSNRPAVQTIAQSEPVAVVEGFFASQRLQDGVNGLHITSIQVLDALNVVLQAHLRAGHYFLWPLAALGLWMQLRQRRLDAGYVLMLILLGVHTMMLCRLAITSGYTSERHTLLTIALVAYAAGVGLWGLHLWLKHHGLASFRSLPLLLSILLIALCCLPQSLQPLHAKQEGHRQAGLWLKRKKLDPNRDQLIDPYGWVTFYCGFLKSPKPDRDNLRYVVGVIDPRDNDLNRIQEWKAGSLLEYEGKGYRYEAPPAVWSWPSEDKPKLIIRQRSEDSGLGSTFSY
jgi:hypothetical protein